jgi:Mrp family chromosome partitioning ATPase
MGRILETFTQAEGRRNRLTEEEPLPPAVVPEPEPAPATADDWGPGDDPAVPFVEVGGPRPGRSSPAPASAATSGLLTIRFQPWPIAAATRDRRFAAELIAYHQPEHPVSAQYRALRDALADQLPADGPRVILFTAVAAAAGATTVALNLAVTLAQSAGTRVAVVEANPVRPAVGERLGLSTGPGLRELLNRTAPLSWALRNTDLENLSALPVGKPVDEPLPVEGLAAALERLRGQFDWVLVDAPAWEAGPEAVALAAACDATYLVLRQGGLDEPEVEAVQRSVGAAGGELRGFVLTQP